MQRINYYTECLGSLKRSLYILFFLLLTTTTGSNYYTRRRDIYHFARMVYDATNKIPLEFNNYGNYCGLGGEGNPVDPLDCCCQIHDACYSYIQANVDCSHNTFLSLIVERYKYTMDKENNIHCLSDTDSCSQMACICDRALATCLREFIDYYNPKHRHG